MLIQEIAKKGTAYDPTLVVIDSFSRIAKRDTSLLEDPLARQTISAKLLGKMREWIRTTDLLADAAQIPPLKDIPATKNLQDVYKAGVPLVLGTDAGNVGTFHGAAVHREMELWQEAGIAPADILKAATGNAAKLLQAENRIGKVAKGFDASLLLVDGNPLDDIRGTRRISDVFFKGERVRRSNLFVPAEDQ